jgi:ferredoxin
VLRPDRPRDARLARSRLARWRAAVLVGVYVLMAAHLVHWAVRGRTMGPVVLSDAMWTLERGEVNPGFILFAAAILVTLVAGRFLCGWICHMGALQELCAWLLRRWGIRPRMFESRLLGYVPVALAAYMFLWPTAKRLAVVPALERVWPAGAAWLGPVPEFPGFSNGLVTTDLWGRLPGVAVAIPFLLISGFATVLFLGARGLCRYGCPYGGVFMPVERLSPGRIRVDPGACDGCGLCTAACTSGVRVLEETRAYGRVVDSRCVRSMDCVSVCPKGALSLALTRPALLRGRRRAGGAAGGTAWAGRAGARERRYDLGWGGELAVAGVFLGSVAALRGVYGVIPLLMAVSMAACVSFGAWKGWRLVRDRDARWLWWQLKRAGRLRPAGLVFGAAVAAGLALTVHCGAVRVLQWRAGVLDGRVRTPAEVVYSGRDAEPADRELAGRALRLYRLGASARRGGVGLAETPGALVREAWLLLVLGRAEEAEAALESVIERTGATDGLVADSARVAILRGGVARAEERLRTQVKASPRSPACRQLLASMLMHTGRMEEALAVVAAGVEADAGRAGPRILHGAALLEAGRPADAAAVLGAAEPLDGWHAGAAHLQIVALVHAGAVAAARDALQRAVARFPAQAENLAAAAAALGIERRGTTGGG